MEFAKREWREALERFENDVIDKAIRQCRDRDDFPPTLPQFISYCRQANVKFVKTSTETGSVTANPKVFEHHMKVIKGILHNNREKHNASPNS